MSIIKKKKKNGKTISVDALESKLSDMFEKKIRDLGLDKTKRKKKVVGDKADVSELKGVHKIAKFLEAVVYGDDAVAKQLAEGVGADGGYLVPVEFRAEVIKKLDKIAVIRPRATIIPMRRDKMEIPAEDGGVTAFWVAENTGLTESDATFEQLVLNTNKLTGLSKMSRELFADSAVGVVDYITDLFGRTFANEEDRAFMTGAGTTEPLGIRTYTVPTVAQAGVSLVAEDLFASFYGLPVQYRTNAYWLMHNSVIQLVRGLKDGAGRYLWTDGLNDAPATILGRPVLEQNDIPINLGGGSDESEIWFGDLKYYYIGDRERMGVETTTVGAGAFETHQVAVKVWERIDGQLGLTDAWFELTAVK